MSMLHRRARAALAWAAGGTLAFAQAGKNEIRIAHSNGPAGARVTALSETWGEVRGEPRFRVIS